MRKYLFLLFLLMPSLAFAQVSANTAVGSLDAKATPIGADILLVTDSADSNYSKRSTIAQTLIDANIPDTITIDNATLAATVSTITGLAPDTATTQAAQPNITSVGTLTTLQVDNININGNTMSSTAGTDLLITPLAGQQIVLDGTIVVDAGVVTGATSITSTAFVGDITGDVTGNVSGSSGSTTGNAATATALAANGANCSAGSYPLGVDAAGAVESCTDATTEIDSAISTHASDDDAHQALVTLNASATTGGMSLAGQEISNRAATNAQTGYATAAHITAIEANTGKTTESTTAGRSLTLSTYEVIADEETYVYTARYGMIDPVATDDFFIDELAHAVTFTSIYCKTLVGTVDLDLSIAGTDINGTDITCNTTGVLDASLGGDTAGAVGEEVAIVTTSVASSPTYIMIILNGTYDD